MCEVILQVANSTFKKKIKWAWNKTVQVFLLIVNAQVVNLCLRAQSVLKGGGWPSTRRLIVRGSVITGDYAVITRWLRTPTNLIVREDKKGYIPDHLPTILQRLDMDARHWLYLTKNFEQPFKGLVGAAHHVRKACEDLGKCWVHGISQCVKLFCK